MVFSSISNGFKTTMKHFWSILAMIVPTALIAVLLWVIDGVIAAYEPLTSLHAGSSFLSIVSGIIVAVVFQSAMMGYLKSDRSDDFKFKNAFVAFTDGSTWLVTALYVVFMEIINFLLYIVLLVGAGFGVFAVLPMFGIKSHSVTETIAVIIVGLAVFIAGLAIYLFVESGLAYVFFAYYDNTKGAKKPEILSGFADSWHKMKGHRWEFIGMVIMMWLISLAIALVVGIILTLVSVIFGGMLHWVVFTGLLITLGIIASVIIIIVIKLWINMVIVKFYEQLK